MWKRGERKKLADMAGISMCYLSNILSRRVRVRVEVAIRLAEACQELRVPITREEWAFNKETENKFFAPKVGKENG